MSAKRAYYGMLATIVLLIGLCAVGTYFANTLLKKEGQKVLDLKLEQAVIDRQEASLQQAKRDIKEYEELESIAKVVVPQEKDQARTVLELVDLAEETGITLSSIEFPESLLGQAAGKKSANAKNQKTVDSNTTQLTELTDLKGVYVMEIRVQSDTTRPITYNQLLDYLKKLENNRRTAQVTDLNITPDSENRNLLTFNLLLNSYVKP